MNGIHFGTGGWRAVIADDFTRANVEKLCRGLALLMKEEGVACEGVCIGYDRRFLSREASLWAGAVFAKENIPVEWIDKDAPTPLIMFAVKKENKPYGLAVTASHNPAVYNGVKVFTRGGRDAVKEVTDSIEAHIDALGDEPYTPMEPEEALEKGLIKRINPLNDYIDSILSLINVEAIKEAVLRVALDPMYGVSRTSLQTILLTARCEVEVIHDRHDTLFGGRLPAPNVDTLRALSAFVVENECDLGIATDGDADRLGIIDEAGVFLHPNKLLVLLYYYLLEYRGWKGACVRNNSTTHLLDRVAAAHGEKCYEVPVGFKYISAKMEETDAVIGGESSGGMTVRGHIAGKDGIYAAALMCEMMAVTHKGLSQLYKEITDKYGEVFSADGDWRMTPERKEALSEVILTEKLRPEFPFPIDRISYQDGCKIYFANGGWVVCRFSGTEPLLRAAAEMGSEQDARRCVELWREFLKL